ncbi:MAG: hypothetical protein AAF447_23700 [Myxococcota bacterium]
MTSSPSPLPLFALAAALTLGVALPARTAAQPEDTATQHAAHGPGSEGGFSHVFTRRARRPEGVQLAFHYGLLQPALLRGLNAAVDVRWKRWVLSYSHGAGLQLPDATLSGAEQDAGLVVNLPWSTGFGVGAVLVDELYALVDVKLHGVQVRGADVPLDYRTLTVGVEVGYRLFLWRGLHITPVLRFWPNVYTSIDRDGVDLPVGGTTVRHEPIEQGAAGFFANVLIGWAFEADR